MSSGNTSFSYTKSVKNVNLLISYLKNVLGGLIDSYDYNATTSALNVRTRSALTTDQQLALNTLVNSFVDSTVLTPADVTNPKHVRLFKSSNQNIPLPLNTVVPVQFKSASYIDRIYFQTAPNANFIFIQKPGIYLVLCKVGASLVPGGTMGTASVVQWYLTNDDTRSDSLYMNVANTNVYTFHPAQNTMSDTTMLACTINVTSASGTYLRLTCRQTLGTSPLTIDPDLTTMTIVSVPGMTFYEGNITTAVTLNATTPSTLALGSDRVVQSPFTHTAASTTVTVTQPGYVLYFAKSTVNKTTGTDSSAGQLTVLQNGTAIANTASYSPVVSALNNKVSFHTSGLAQVNANDTFSIQAQIYTGSALQATSGECGLVLVYLHPAVLQMMNALNVGVTTGQTSISTTPTDINLSGANVTIPAATPSMSTSGTTVSVNNPGLYLLINNLTLSTSSGFGRECGIYNTSSADAGKSFYSNPGSLSIRQNNPNGNITLNAINFFSLTPSSRVKLQCLNNAPTTDNIATNSNSQLAVISFAGSYSNTQSDAVFGNNYNVAMSGDDLLINTSSFTEVCRLVYVNLDAGIYKLTTSICIDLSSVALGTMTNILVQISDVHTDTGNTYIVHSKTLQYPTGIYYVTILDFGNLAAGSHNLMLQISSPANVGFTIRNVVFDAFRVI